MSRIRKPGLQIPEFESHKRCALRYFWFVMFVLGIVCVFSSFSFAGGQLVVDNFEYADELAAQQAWILLGEGDSKLVKLVDNETQTGEKALVLPCNFSAGQSRSFWDRAVELDLDKYNGISFMLYIEKPESVPQFTLYFQSGSGWYQHTVGIKKSGWQKIMIPKDAFQIEDQPIGWNQITKIRLSPWRGEAIDSIVEVDDLVAITVLSEIVVVHGDLTVKSGSPEATAVGKYSSQILSMLENMGIEAVMINDSDVESGKLSRCELAIFPYNPDISEKEIAETEKFVGAGGKIFVFYTIPVRMSSLLGIEGVRFMAAERPGQFETVRFVSTIVEGLPETMHQGSWNIKVVKPARDDAKVIGWWYDVDGKSTGLPAMILSNAGVYMSDILTDSDEEVKKHMLIALIARVMPDVWQKKATDSALARLGQFASFNNYDECVNFLKANAKGKPSEKNIVDYLDKAQKSKDGIKKAMSEKRFKDVLAAAEATQNALMEAYYYIQTPRKDEFRAVWCHEAFPPFNTWEESIKLLKESGFNAIVVNMLWAGVAYYPSEILPVADEIKEKGDQIALAVEAARKYGVQIHVWKVNWNLGDWDPKKFVEKMRTEERLQKDRFGNEVKWLCPSHPENFKLELESMLEVVRKYDVDGLHFDYIRYPDSNSCYCPGCKKRFEETIGESVINWPQDVITGKYSAKFADWHREQITRLVRAVSEQAHKIKPKIKISAAVFPYDYDTVGQDWPGWVKNGYLDFLCPMDYTDSNIRFKAFVTNHLKEVKRSIPVYPGIHASTLNAAGVIEQIQIARTLGTDGFIIFNYDTNLARDILPNLAKGITKITK